MKWIDTTDIKQWADRLDSQGALPLLVRKLIRATANTIDSIHFPSGDNISLGGWDGILKTSEATEYIPSGLSLWEFGTNKDVKGKADDDYDKRTFNPLGFNSSEATYVFVTPRIWANKETWIQEKKKDKKWKDIKVIDAETLEEWIENAPTVGSWLAKHLGKYPSEGIQPTEDFWEEWSTGTKFNLNENILLGGREALKDCLLDKVKESRIIPIQGISREEALAFIVSCFINNKQDGEDFFARSIIVDNPETYRKLATSSKPLILIPRFDDFGIINRAINNGHTVLIPLGIDSSDNWEDKLELPGISRESFISALIQIGFNEETAEQNSKETTRNITILRRKLGFEHTIPEWAHPDNVSDIIPALIAGRWDESEEGDKEVISRLSNDTYENYTSRLSKWLYSSDSPIIKIGSKWRLASPFDSWTNASKFLNEGNFKLLQTIFLDILNEIDPVFDLSPKDRIMAGFLNKKRKYSSWIREGIIQSLILASIFSERLNLAYVSEQWVDRIIRELLSSNIPNLWKSFESKLPLIAEASPSAFLSSLEDHLKKQDSLISSLFEEGPGLILPQSYLTGMLWALEGLAWFPEYLSRSAIILAKLAAIDPGGSLSNRPINSLTEIFKPWHYQTLASFNDRMGVLKLITEKEPKIGWELLIKMLSMQDVASQTHKTRWRMFELENISNINYTYNEIFKTHSTILDIILSLVEDSEEKLSQLIKVADNLNVNDRNKIFSYINSRIETIERTQNLIWHTCREELYHHRSYSDAKRALSNEELDKYQTLYDRFYPDDEIESGIWMFDEYFPKFHIGHQYKSETDEEYIKYIENERIRSLTDIYTKYGLEGIIKLIPKVKEVWILGDTSSHITDLDMEIIEICKLLGKGEKELLFARSFICKKAISKGFTWITCFYAKLKEANFNNVLLAKYLTSFTPSQEIWRFLQNTNKETIDKYWYNVSPHFQVPEDRIFGVEKLIEYRRFFSAMNIVCLYKGEMPTALIMRLLKDSATIEAKEKGSFDDYKINVIFKELDARSDIENNELAQLEWMYITILASYHSQRKPKCLYTEIAKDPVFFIDLVKCAYKSDDEDTVEKTDHNGLSEEQIQIRATMAYKLLHSWNEIPGCNEGKIDSHHLNEWINKVRDLATNCGRIKIVDSLIGKVLAHYPTNKEEILVPEEICQIIEDLNSDSLSKGFYCEMINKQGVTTRGAFDGGDIERDQAAYYHELAKKHRNKFLVITTIFEDIAKGYEFSAKQIDDEAEIKKLDC